MNLLKVYTEEDGTILDTIHEDGVEYVWAINEATNQLSFTTRSPAAIKGFKEFLSKHPIMTGVAVGVGLNALDTYRSNKRLTTRFFATNEAERRLYKKVAEDLVATGQYRMMRNGRRMKGGWMWELKRKRV